MTRYLLATTSVHTTAAAADYLDPREDDEVVVLTVAEPDLSERDAGDAANVARTRLLPAMVTAVERDGESDPATAIREAATGRDVDVILVGTRRGDPDPGDRNDGAGAETVPGSTTRALLGTVDVPVVVLPVPT